MPDDWRGPVPLPASRIIHLQPLEVAARARVISSLPRWRSCPWALPLLRAHKGLEFTHGPVDDEQLPVGTALEDDGGAHQKLIVIHLAQLPQAEAHPAHH